MTRFILLLINIVASVFTLDILKFKVLIQHITIQIKDGAMLAAILCYSSKIDALVLLVYKHTNTPPEECSFKHPHTFATIVLCGITYQR